ncbi:MAG: hypothetical protein AD742_11930 [Methylibium sp. NZG]|nr:MAG: hypothetical protein AD742_11930 [Methylibium sp. NZG]
MNAARSMTDPTRRSTPLLTLMSAAVLMALGATAAIANETDKAIDPAAAVIENQATSGVAFRRIDGVPLSSENSNLPVAADEGLWRRSRGLPEGAKLLMSVSAASAPADGKTALRLRIKAFDAAGNELTALDGAPLRVRLETSLGRFQVPGVASTPGNFTTGTAPGAQLTTTPTGQPVTELAAVELLLDRNGQATVVLMAPVTPGDAVLRASSGAVGVQGEISFVPDLRPLIAVGIVEGAINFSKVKKTDPNAPTLTDTEFEESLRHWSKTNSAGDRTLAGRAALFVKGTIKGEYLLTAAADSDKLTREKLFRDVDPNAFYPIYGDASIKEYDAQSKSRVYVRIDKDKSYLLYGDYTTASNDAGNRLASYSRSLTGAKWHFENQTVKVNAYAARDLTRNLVDEQPGRGISGPYALGQPNAIVNSEVVELIVRDRNAPAIVLKRQTLVRYADYDFEPFSGRLLFRQPVPSVDENLNPVSIRVAYEVEEGSVKHWVGGVDAKVKIGENLAIGGSVAEDRNPAAPYRIAGVNAELKLGTQTYIVAEVAQSKGNQYVNQTLAAFAGAAPIDQTGRAGRIEMRHDGEALKARAYVARSGSTFQNPSAGLAPGRQEAGVRGDYPVTETITANAELLQTKDNSGTVTDGANRNAASVGAGIKLSDRIKLDVSVNRISENQIAGTGGVLSPVDAQQSSLGGLGWNSNTTFGIGGSGLLASPSAFAGLSPNAGAPALVPNSYTSVKARLTAKVTDDATVYGEYERATDDRQRAAVGGEYRIDEKSRAYAKHEFANSLTGIYGLTTDGSKSHSTVLGVDTEYMKDGQVFSEYRLAGAQNGSDAAAAMGVRNLWRVAAGVNLTTSFERQQLNPATAASQEATAVSLGADYTADARYKMGGRLEYRTSDTQDAWLSSLAYDRKLNDDWAALLRNLYLRQTSQGIAADNGQQTQDRLQLGLAYRDTQTNFWHGLGRLELRTERSSAVSAPVDSRAWIASLHANVQPNRAWVFAGQVAHKNVAEAFASPTGATNANGLPISTLGERDTWRGTLLSGRATWDFAERFDASAYASVQTAKGTRLNGLGGELGYRVMDNLWLSLGYTGGKYSDVDTFSSNQSWNGWHLRLRFKFDEKTFSRDDPRVNRTLDGAADGANPRQWRE